MAKVDSHDSATTGKASQRRVFGYVVTAVYETAGKGDGPNIHSIELSPDQSDVSYVHGTVVRLGYVQNPLSFKPGARVNLIIEPAS